MSSRALIVGATLAITAGGSVASMQTTTPTTVDGLVSAGKTTAGTDWAGTFLRLCIPPPPAGGRGRGAAQANAAPPWPPPKSNWYAEPAKVADNFYFLGTKIHNSWALVGSDGIIII